MSLISFASGESMLSRSWKYVVRPEAMPHEEAA
jgi:hypothetical protein